MVGVSYGGVQGIVAAGRIRVCSTIIPESIWDRIRVWYSKDRRDVCIPLLKHTGRSLLWHPKSGSRTLDGGSDVKVVHQMDRGVWH
jgi:hypothetical protein